MTQNWSAQPYSKVSFFGQCSKMQLIPLQNFIIKTCFIQFLWFFRLKCWFKGQIISRIHLSLPNAYKLMCFDRNINGNRDDKFFDWDYWSLHWPKKLTLIISESRIVEILALSTCVLLLFIIQQSIPKLQLWNVMLF